MKIITLKGKTSTDIQGQLDKWIEYAEDNNIVIKIRQLDVERVEEGFEWIIGYEEELKNQYAHLLKFGDDY